MYARSLFQRNVRRLLTTLALGQDAGERSLQRH